MAFYVVYIEEAHAADSWQMPVNVKQGVVFDSPQSYTERVALGRTCVRKLGIEMPADRLASTWPPWKRS